MGLRITVKPDAVHDLDEQFDYYEAKGTPETADRWLNQAPRDVPVPGDAARHRCSVPAPGPRRWPGCGGGPSTASRTIMSTT